MTDHLDLTVLQAQAHTDIASQVEQWLQKIAEMLHLTPEQLAARYELHWEPVTVRKSSDGASFAARVHLELKSHGNAALAEDLAPIFLEPITPKKARLR